MLKVVQSVFESLPMLEAEANGRLKVMIFDAAEMVKSEPLVEVASVWVPPDCVWLSGPMAVMPAPEVESVVPVRVRPEPTVSVLTGDEPLPMRMPVKVVEPVPPCPTPSTPARRLKPMEEEATSLPLESRERSDPAASEVNQVAPE